MTLKYIIGTAALSLIFAGTAYPQQEQEKEKPQQQEQKPAEKPKTQQKQEQQSAKQQQGEQKQEQKNEQKSENQAVRQQSEQPKHSEQSNRQRQDQQKQLTRQEQEEQKQQQKQQQQQVAKQQRSDDRNQHSDRGHGRIPDDRFRASFGREHHFRVEHVDNRRFHYGGYWFTFNDVWPAAWLYTDDFYIDFIDGQYYLIDLTHPGIQLLLVVE